TPDGPRIVIKPFQPLENYAPRLYDWKKILDKSHPLGFNQEVLEALVQSRQARDMAQAAQILREVRRGTLTNNPKAFFEYGRTVELPDKFLLPASVRAERWAQDVSAQLSLYEVFGGRLERLEDMKSVLGQSGIDPEVANYVNKALDHYLGTITPTRMSRLLSEVRSWNNIHKMLLSSIPNSAQGFLMSTTRYGLINTLRAMKDVLFAKGATREALEEFAIRAGAALDPEAITQLMGEMVDEGFFSPIASKALRLYGFTASERFNQMLAIRVAWNSANDLFRALQSGKVPSLYQRAIGNNPARIRRMFQMAGVDIDAALQRGYLTMDDYVRVAHEFNRTTQFTHSVLDTPLWTDTPLGKTVFQYKRFVYRMTPMIRKEIYEEAKRFFVTKGRDGSIRPFLTFATLFPAVGWTIRQIRAFISGYERDPDESVLTNIAESMAWVGGLGIFEELNTLLQGDFYSVAKTLGGPSMGIIENLLGMAGGLYKAGVAGTIGKDPDEAQRQLASAARHAVRGILPIQIGAPLARGDVPLVGRVIGQDARDRAFIGLAQVFRPEEASSEHLAQKHYNKVMKQIERGYAIALENAVLRGEADFSQFIKALEDAERLGVFITLDDFMRRLDSPTTQLEILKRLRKNARSAHQREVIDLLIQKAKIMQSEQRRENIPRPALGVLERIER